MRHLLRLCLLLRPPRAYALALAPLSAAVLSGLGAAQVPSLPPQPPQTTTQNVSPSAPEAELPLPQLAPQASWREAERAASALQKATRRAYRFDYARSVALANLQSAAPQGADQTADASLLSLLELAQGLLQEANADYASGAFFLSERKARAAEDLYKAAEHLQQGYGALLGAEPGRGRGRGRSRSERRALEAPYRAQDELLRLDRELAFYTPEDERPSQLREAAHDLLNRALTPLPSAEGLPLPPAFASPYSPLPSYAEAAREVARAGRHLLEGLRGF
jgi:hypothetical protein